jgi:hypothetical protein
VLELFYSQTVSVETYTGAGETGDDYAAAVTVTGLLDDGLLLKTDGPTGDTVQSVTVFYCPLSEGPKFVPQSRVTTALGVMQVDRARHRQASPIFGNVEHLEVRLV